MNKITQYRVDDRPDPDSVDDDLDQKDSKVYQPNVPKEKTGLKIAIIVIIGLLLIGGLTYYIGHKPTKPKGHISSQKIIQVTPNNTSSPDVKYVSNGNDLNLSFSYPQNWSVAPPTNDNKNDNTITLTSPLSTVINADNTSVVGKIIIQVRPGTDTINELNNNTPITALASAQIAYSQPTANQTSYPFISYVHFSNGSKASGAFEEVIITGGISFALGQSISAEYLSGLDPIISASFYQCATQSCIGTSQSLLSINSNTWQNTSIFKQVLTTLESFQLN